MITAATKRVRVSRVMVVTIKVAGNKEGKSGMGHGVGNKGGMQQRGQWARAMMTRAREMGEQQQHG
jgi:hypothetical protein